MPEQSAPDFGVLLRQLRTRAQLTQQELAKAATLSTRTVSDLERGINRTAHRATAELLAEALDLAGLERTLFVAAARGRPVPVPAGSSARRNDITRSVTSTGALIGRDGELAMLVRLMAEVAAGASDIGAMILVRAWERAGDDAAFLADLR